ncbi:toll/interleukin-1 receptor domain-containing protein [Undibacterium sp. CY7W]|uniref:Toll/interleukin-1 receptor domain-containing protein n=1 Tax=Undibacterium rugosum TaxID=2762291 RepID=A0A923I0N2_9BURK|nr:toll/interleukin-1 receptor domain-containing protein [Undibacterium rugosum]MBC3935633.1 toll/interleukin-1 receptor domain-containing protein [Undibacterium rugosum]
MYPKAFISHASEDKARFVVRFAERLRASGVDAWLDRWEMFPGDSLVDKIFEEGLRNANAVVVVLSTHSVSKPWVREELNAAFVAKINSGSRLIPVLIDNCEVPAALASTLWERIDDLNSYDASFDRIVASITGVREKPPLGALPGYVTSPIKEINGLARIDNLVLKASCEHALENGDDLIDGPDLITSSLLIGTPEQELSDSIEVLEHAGLLNVSRHLGSGLPHFRITTYGFQQYAKTYITGYSEKIQDVAVAVVNLGLQDNESIALKLDLQQYLVDHALKVLESQQYLQLSQSLGGHIHIFNVSATLRRALL